MGPSCKNDATWNSEIADFAPMKGAPLSASSLRDTKNYSKLAGWAWAVDHPQMLVIDCKGVEKMSKTFQAWELS